MTGDTPPQPGWWKASDGQWYPPQQAEQASPPPPAPPPDATGEIPAQPGWWQASDGQWYPPQQTAQPAPPPPPNVPQQPAAPPPPAAPQYGAAPPPNVPQQPVAPPPPSVPQYGAAPPPGTWGDPAGAPSPGGNNGNNKVPWIIGAVVAVLAIGGIALFAMSGDDGGGEGEDSVATDSGGTEGDGGTEGTTDGGTEGTTDGGTGGLGDDTGGDDGGLDVGVVDDGMGDDGVFTDDSTGDDSNIPDPPPEGPAVAGNEGEPHNNIAVAAIVDIEEWWTEIMPSVYGIEYVPIQGGFFAASPDEPPPPCAQSAADVRFNAYYCGLEDVIAWDDTELFPQFLDSSGPLAIGVIMAHEFGHAIQQRVNNMSGFTVTLEHQADCFAGAWVAKIQERGDDAFEISPRALDAALAAFLQLGDSPGSSATDPSAHGNAFDRINGFQIGLESGAAACAEFTDDNITITELPFNDEEDFVNEGNLPLADSLELFPADLEAFWAEAYPEITGEPWIPLQGGFITFDSETETLTCGGTPVDLLLFYCIDDDYVALDRTIVARTLHDDIGDFAVASLVASQYGLALQQRAGVGRDVLLNNLQADCLAGVWAGSIFPLSPRVVDQTSLIILSPGDFDEAVGALLFLGSDPVSHGTGFERVTAFRAGVIDGIEGCFAYDPPA